MNSNPLLIGILSIAASVIPLQQASAATLLITADNRGIVSATYGGVAVTVTAQGTATNPRFIEDADNVTSLSKTYTITGIDYATGGGGGSDTFTFNFTASAAGPTGSILAPQNTARTGFGIGDSTTLNGSANAQLSTGEILTLGFNDADTGDLGYTVDSTKFTSVTVGAIAGGEVITINSQALSADGTYTLTNQLDTLTAQRTTGTADGVTLNGLTYEFEINAIPEPSSTTLLGLGGLALILRRRRA